MAKQAHIGFSQHFKVVSDCDFIVVYGRFTVDLVWEVAMIIGG